MSAAPADWPLGTGVRWLGAGAGGVLALEKPAGVLSHPNAPKDQPRSRLQAAYDPEAECYQWQTPEGERRLWLLHRLDSPTSGVLLLADNAPLADALREAFASRAIEKTYFALVKGRLQPSPQIWRDRLKTEKNAEHLRSETGGSTEALTEAELAEAPPGLGLSLLRLRPKTGRTHQLRVQCARHQHPIVGDRTYGDFALNNRLFQQIDRRLYLHAAEVHLTYEWQGKTRHFAASSPLPQPFRKALQPSQATPAKAKQRFLDKLSRS